jgi:signal transduction histidine kinase/ActR/RegA family two-component response regulator
MSIRQRIFTIISVVFLMMIVSLIGMFEFFVMRGYVSLHGQNILRYYCGSLFGILLIFFFLLLAFLEKIVIVRQIVKQQHIETELRASEKMKLIGMIAAGVAHDLNNVLSGIVSYPEMILMMLPADSPFRQKLIRIKASGEKAGAIVQDMLTLVRRGAVTDEIVNMNHIIAEYIKSPEAERLKSLHPDVRFTIQIQDDVKNIIGSPLHLSKTLMNLCFNAAEAAHDGGEVVISAENRHIDRTVRGYGDSIIEKGEYVVLSVSDTGIGISEDNLKQIFEPFYSRKTMGRSGTGLGTTIIWETVKDHKGYINVQSAVGKGTRFDLYFPATQQELSIKKSDIPIQSYMGHEKILIVDDMEDQRDIACEMLRTLGYAVAAVDSGEAAIAYLKQHPVDMIILDMMMPDGDGIETYKKIIENHPKQKAIIASGLLENEKVKTALDLGVTAFVSKPYTLKKIGMAIRKGLDNDRRNAAV